MEELDLLLRQHASKYPLMQPTDAVKLLYQNEFGGGHLIRDTASCRAYLRREYLQTERSEQWPKYEQIGNGLVRVHLSAVPAEELDALGEAFLRSAAIHRGELESFLKKLELLRKVCAEGVFSFDMTQLDAYLKAYAQAGYPMVSHSDAYREAYHPAYRIVRTDQLEHK